MDSLRPSLTDLAVYIRQPAGNVVLVLALALRRMPHPARVRQLVQRTSAPLTAMLRTRCLPQLFRRVE